MARDTYAYKSPGIFPFVIASARKLIATGENALLTLFLATHFCHGTTIIRHAASRRNAVCQNIAARKTRLHRGMLIESLLAKCDFGTRERRDDGKLREMFGRKILVSHIFFFFFNFIAAESNTRKRRN